MVSRYRNILHTYLYDAFGNELNPNPDNTNWFRFAGEYFDIETGHTICGLGNLILGRAVYANREAFIRSLPFRQGVALHLYVRAGRSIMMRKRERKSRDTSIFNVDKIHISIRKQKQIEAEKNNSKKA